MNTLAVEEKSAADFDAAILAIFDAQPIRSQPKFLVDLACGDGARLNRLHRLIEEKTRRGRQLAQYPLTYVGVHPDPARQSLLDRNLQGIDHVLLTEDDEHPHRLQTQLHRLGVQAPSDAVFVFAGDASASVSLLRKLDRNDSALLAGHGLVALVSPFGSARAVPSSDNAACDAETFLMAMADLGLFPESLHKAPSGAESTGALVGRFKKREYRVRYATQSDFAALIQLERRCWAPGVRSPAERIKHRVNVYPEGQLVLEWAGKPVAVLYSQRVDTEDMHGQTALTVHRLHRDTGSTLQLLALNVLPEMQDRSCGDQLLEFALQRCMLMPGVSTVIGVTRCKDFHKHPDLAIGEYIRTRNSKGVLVDPILRFHELHGATIKAAIPAYRPNDTPNDGYGVLVWYDVDKRRRSEIALSDAGRSNVNEEGLRGKRIDVEKRIRQTVAALLNENGAAIAFDVPLFEAGLDSADLLRLREAIAAELGVSVDPVFFFEHNTGERIVSYLASVLESQIEESEQEGGSRALENSNDAGADGAALVDSPESLRGVAIVGIGCLLPGGVTNTEQLWALLEEGRSVVGTLPEGRWQWPANIDPLDKHKGIDRGAFLENVERFDPAFFRLSPKEARLMDPQQRQLLQLCWACLEDAGVTPSALSGTKTGVFVGASGSEYHLRLAEQSDGDVDAQFALCGSMAILANRLSYFFDLTGPSIQVDTACSSSLVAVHEAVRAIESGSCDQALVAGINIMCHPSTTIAYYKAGMLSVDGSCKTFDGAANGYVRGEGALVVLLKPVQAAMRDQDRIYAVIRGSATNHGGRAAGLTVPNPVKQADLIVQACASAGIGAQELSYVEAHGTGTALGDPLEVKGLKDAFAQLAIPEISEKAGYCGLGSIKTNVGHLEAAAGLAGLVKIALSMQRRILPPLANFKSLNAGITLTDSPFYVVQTRKPWDLVAGQSARIAGVSSFGSGGSNAHVIVQEYVQGARSVPNEPRGPAIVVLSAKNRERLEVKVEQLLAALETQSLADVRLADLAYTLQVGREAMEARLAIVCDSIDELTAALCEFLSQGMTNERVHFGLIEATGATSAGKSEIADASRVLHHAVASGQYETLLDLWVQGCDFDWTELYASGATPKRIGLPTYPFATERYWLPEGKKSTPTPERATVVAPPAAVPSRPAVDTTAGRDKPAGLQLRSVSQAGKPHVPLTTRVLELADVSRPKKISLPELSSPQLPSKAAQTGAISKPVDSSRGRVSAAASEQLLDELAQSLADALFMDKADVGADKQFAYLGLDSISGVEWVSAINKRYGTSLSATVIYAYPTLRQFAAHVAEVLGDALADSGDVQPERVDSGPATSASAMAGSSEPASEADGGQRNELPDAPSGVPAQETAAHSYAGPAERSTGSERIAIVGMSGRYPGASGLDAYWELLANGRDAVTQIPAARWDVDQYFDARQNQDGKTYSKWLGVMDDVDQFDPLFFGLSAAEAEVMDPQQRIFLQEAYRALEDAGYTQSELNGARCGVYLGISNNEYASLLRNTGRGVADRIGNSCAIAASRISYRLNLRGPAVALDTACSSSLVGAHLAIQALQRHEIDMAIVGGISLYLTPELYILMSASGMLSPDGRCKTFDDRADGIVPGEGAGVLILKRLSDAKTHEDNIHGLIIGSGINQDGKTNGITAPSLPSQVDLCREIYRTHDINPESISYVEMHGTGTKLGDPIELEALATAFRSWTDKKNYCRIGSVKTNIGHVTAAAGVAGMQKVLLSMKHGELPPSIHFSKPNSHFDFSASPFFVGTELTPWHAPQGHMRRAAVSSFGISGTNAHIVLEEYVDDAKRLASPGSAMEGAAALIVLSAKNEERLNARAAQLLAFIEAPHIAEADLSNIAYTLQVGREPMEARLAMSVRSLEELKTKLGAFVAGQKHIAGLYRGEVKRDKDSLSLIIDDEEFQETVEKWIARGKFGKLLELWAKGLIVDWRKLYGKHRPRRISLPTYPFADERYWVPQTNERVAAGRVVLHPLLHENTSTLNEQRFSSTFKGDEFFLRDHVVQGQRVLPGVAHLEMVRAAVARAAEIPPDSPIGIALKQVVFARPLVVGDAGQTVHVALIPQEGGEIEYEVFTQADGDAEAVLHSQGRAQLGEAAPPAAIAVETLRAQCADKRVDRTQCYALFDERGLHYGESFRAIESLHIGRDSQGQPQVLAQLAIPAGVAAEPFVLHPSVMDAALQASLGVRLGESGEASSKMSLPFALERLDVWDAAPSNAWAWVRYSPGCTVNSAVRKLDIDLMDDEGRLCARLQGFTSRVVDAAEATQAAPVGTLLLKPQWLAQAVEAEASAGYAQRWVLLGEAFEALAGHVEARLPQAQCEVLRGEGGIATRYESATTQMLALLQVVLQAKPTGDVLVQVLIADEGEAQLLAGLAAVLKTARLENPKLLGQVIGIGKHAAADDILTVLEANAAASQDVEIRYVAGQRQVLGLAEVTEGTAGVPAQAPWRDGGVYLITGGAGGLGLLFAREIAQRAHAPVLVLSGRSALDEHKQAQLAQLRKLGATVAYRRADMADALMVQGLVDGIVDEFGALHGIVHSAGVLRDNFLLKKTTAELRAVLAPKVPGLVALDEATRGIALDWLVLFSSVAGAFGNVGQADYAAANGFMDRYAAYRNALVAAGRRHGRTISLNWPLWAEGGMQVDATGLAHRQMRGVNALTTPSGIDSFYQAWSCGETQVIVLAGDVGRLRSRLLNAVAQPRQRETSAPSVAPVRADSADWSHKVLSFFRRILADVTKLPIERIDVAAPLEDYGIDSIMAMRLTRELEKSFGSLSKTLFFEYQDLQALAAHFQQAYGDRLAALFGTEPKASPMATPASEALDVKSSLPASHRTTRRFAATIATREASAVATDADIAIIGMSGRYPEARNLDAFWSNLKAGKDCIREIPAERWDHGLYFDADKESSGKSYSKWGGFIEGVDEFDPLFFNISPREAELMDPQERLFLQCVYETLEDAGYTRERLGRYQALGLDGNVGVFVGAMYEEYQLYGAQEQARGRGLAISGNASSIANRVSYFCNFHGPSLAINTMCSSSLTALHLACLSLQRGGCELAIAGGVNVSVHPNKYLLLSGGKFASSKGRCESFGEGGDGYVPGEGVGAVLLKPLAKAIADGDQIHGVIKGTAINHGGKTNGYTVPNPNAQASVIGQALKASGVDPRTISYIEAHGTGTSLGDPIEITGLSKAFGQTGDAGQYCAIGSAKSNIGHCESAAGIAGITKVLLQMKHKTLVPSLHSETLNPNIDFEKTPFAVQREIGEWKRPVVSIDGGPAREYPRIAGVSAFGAGGSNAHVILQEYIPSEDASSVVPLSSSRPAVIVLSAKSDERLKDQVRQLLEAVKARQLNDADLADVAYTLQVGREAMESRLGLLADSVQALGDKLEAVLAGRSVEDVYTGQVKQNKEALGLFANDEDLQQAIESWVVKGKYGKLLDLWTKGMTMDWNKLYDGAKPRRISLPTYPFARQRYWVKLSAQSATAPVDASPGADAPASASGSRGIRYLSKQWEAAAPSVTPQSSAAVLIVADKQTTDIAARLAQRFGQAQVLDVSNGTAVAANWADWQGWIDLTGIGAGFNEIALGWLQQWLEQGPRDGAVALGITCGLESLDARTQDTTGALAAGLYRMLQSEYGRISARHVDLDSAQQEQAWFEQIMAELQALSDEPEVCYRAGTRYRSLLAESEPGSVEMQGNALDLAPNAVVWVTGGTRGLGYLCAQHLVRQYGVKRLVLSGRDALPAREQWSAYRDGTDAVSQKIRAIEALEAQGAQVRVSAVALDDTQALNRELAAIKATLGHIGALFHAAGSMDLNTPALIRKSPAGIREVLRPKVEGLTTLLAALANEPLRSVVLFSSVSAVVPSLGTGRADYAMANAYMDYVAQAKARTERYRMVSIQWPSWKESGIGESRSAAYQKTGLLTHTDAEGLGLLDEVLRRGLGPVVMPAIVDVSRFDASALMSRPVPSKPIPTRPAVSVVTDAQPLAAEALETRALSWLKALVAEQLRLTLEEVEADTPLPDYGADSVMLAQMLRPISTAVGVPLDPSIVYEHSTLNALTRWLVKTHGEALAVKLPGNSDNASDSVEPDMPSTSKVETPDVQVAQEALPTSLPQREPRHLAASIKPDHATKIAVVGLSCRFPGAPTLDAYWQLLANGESAIKAIPQTRWGKQSSTYYAGLLDNVTHFDPEFFLISRDDARAMDPQALLLLEESLSLWHHAGYRLAEVKGRPIGVYLGARSQHRPDEQTFLQANNPILTVGQNYLAANISRYYDLRGPSVVVDTACSSALVAMNMAIQALKAGDIEAALVGGASVLQSDGALRLFERRGILNREPHFHVFDQRARGAVLGEGVGLVMLKRLDDALADGDAIYGVIDGMAINNDGRTAGPAAPNIEAQREVMRSALARSGRTPESVSHIEANGSGSEVTDLLELKAIESVYRADSGAPCELGAIKPNIGHPLSAEGIASFIKVILMLHHGQRVPFLSAQQPMTHYDFAASPFRFNRRLTPWGEWPAVAGINCFGDGGTNAHVIVSAWQGETDGRFTRLPIEVPALKRIDIKSTTTEPAQPTAPAARDTRLDAEPESNAGAMKAAFWE
ncbi:SDR family NAD(P)-dependent oxidoreductase [Trinickia sp. NRRL B-1857]|uniref:SDR family NAD(P)-dependent oxidoreductase n=1 Tax=Trinickia sp. NRRL B-1857 TaxID=3162879 RepID=UPI003D266FEC